MTESFSNITLGSLILILLLYVLSQFKILKNQFSITNFIPLSLIIGLLFSVVINLLPYNVNFESFSNIAFHIFNLSVISMGLTVSEKKGKQLRQKTIWGGIWMTAIFTTVLCIQSVTGFSSVALYNIFAEQSFFEGYGLLSGHSFAQGSGHAMSIGTIWEKEYNLKGALSIGLTFSAIGYLVAVIVGIPFTKWLLRNSDKKNMGYNTILETHIPISSKEKPVRKLDYIYNAIIILVVYILSIIIAYIIRDVILRGLLKEFNIAQMISNIIVGLIFVIGLALAIVFKFLILKIKSNTILHSAIQKKYTLSLIDILIIATFLSIEYAIITQVGVPIVLILLTNIFITCLTFYVIKKKSKANFLNERIAALLGTTFGSLANGLILLKILDPKVKSPVYYELALMNFYSAFTLGHIMFIIFAVGEWNNLSSIAEIYALTMVISMLLARFVERKL